MKISLLGKGGCGKSTVSSMLALNLSNRGYRVLIIDSDESNFGVNRLLGLEEPMELMDYLGGKSNFSQKMRESANKTGKGEPLLEIFGESWGIDDIPRECLSTKGNISLLQIGKVKHFGEGCACAMGVLSKNFMETLKLGPKEIAILDTEAGVEHVSRGVERGIDISLIIMDPSYESIRLCEKMERMMEEGGKPTKIVLNRFDQESINSIKDKIDFSKVVAVFEDDRNIRMSGLKGEPVKFDGIEVDRLAKFIISSIV